MSDDVLDHSNDKPSLSSSPLVRFTWRGKTVLINAVGVSVVIDTGDSRQVQMDDGQSCFHVEEDIATIEKVVADRLNEMEVFRLTLEEEIRGSSSDDGFNLFG